MNPPVILPFKHAPLSSVDIERSFSKIKTDLRDIRFNMCSKLEEPTWNIVPELPGFSYVLENL